MTAVPYTRDAVKALRFAAAKDVPAAEILDSFGWDAAMLTRVCRTHGIDLIIARPTRTADSAVVAPTLADQAVRQARLSRGGNNAPKPRASAHPLASPTVASEFAEPALEQLIAEMPNQQRSILGALNAARKVSPALVSASALNDGKKVGHVVRAINIRLRLRGLPFTTEHVGRQKGQGKPEAMGYRLVEVRR